LIVFKLTNLCVVRQAISNPQYDVLMPRPITDEQAAQVIRQLAKQEDYLKRLAKRLAARRAPQHLVDWAEKASWSVGGLTTHFAMWAKDEPGPSIQTGHQIR
jgi:hypothetical protein